MSRLKVRWSVTVEYQAEVEVDGYDADSNGWPSNLKDARNLDEAVTAAETDANCVDHGDIDYLSVEVVREGEAVELTAHKAPTREADWDW